MTEIIDVAFLRRNPDYIFVFGDNLLRYGYGGAALLRDEPNTYGFITKKAPNNNISSFYRPEEYAPVFAEEIDKLKKLIVRDRHKTFLISEIGSGLANKFHIWERVIEPGLETLANEPNVILLWRGEIEQC